MLEQLHEVRRWKNLLYDQSVSALDYAHGIKEALTRLYSEMTRVPTDHYIIIDGQYNGGFVIIGTLGDLFCQGVHYSPNFHSSSALNWVNLAMATNIGYSSEETKFWQTLTRSGGNYQFEYDSKGYTGWYRCENGQLSDGRHPEWNNRTGEQRYTIDDLIVSGPHKRIVEERHGL